MAKASDNEFPSVLFAEQPDDVDTPGADLWRAYFKADGLYLIDGAGVVTGPLTAGGVGGGGLAVEDETGTSYTVDSGDDGKIKRFTAAGLVTVTLPDGLAVNTVVELLAWGAAGLAVQDNGTSVVHQEGSIAQYEAVSCVVVAANTWSVAGPLT